MEKINILSKYAEFNSHWTPHSIAELNGQHVLLAKVVGEFVWHSHADEDELFHVIKGKLKNIITGKVPVDYEMNFYKN